MKKLLSLVLALSLILSCFALAAAEGSAVREWAKEQSEKLAPDARELNIFTWAEYIPTAVVDQFMEDTGIVVNYSALMGDNEEIRAKLTSSPGLYDIVVCSD